MQETLADLDEDSDLYYSTIMTKMPYLDAVVHETLRKYPPIKRIERKLTGADEYRIGGALLKRGMMVNIPTLAIHHSESFYPDPHLFIPERFLPANKDKLVPYTYLPFSSGPRNCGSREILGEIPGVFLINVRLINLFHFFQASAWDSLTRRSSCALPRW